MNLFRIEKKSDILYGADTPFSRSEALEYIYKANYSLEDGSLDRENVLKYYYIESVERGDLFIRITVETQNSIESFILSKDDVPYI